MQRQNFISPLQTRLFVSLVHCVPGLSDIRTPSGCDWFMTTTAPALLSARPILAENDCLKASFHLFNLSFCITGLNANAPGMQIGNSQRAGFIRVPVNVSSQADYHRNAETVWEENPLVLVLLRLVSLKLNKINVRSK